MYALHHFIYLATRPLLAAITTPHRLYALDPVVMIGSVAPHSVVVLSSCSRSSPQRRGRPRRRRSFISDRNKQPYRFRANATVLNSGTRLLKLWAPPTVDEKVGRPPLQCLFPRLPSQL
jgi:hypothetical protein